MELSNMKPGSKRIILSLLVLLAAGIAPNVFVIAEAGYASMRNLALEFLIPSIMFLAIVIAVSWLAGERDLVRQIRTGVIAGLVGTIGLEIIRETGFRLGGMPGELPELMGVLLLNRFADGPNFISNIVGWSYHFWNGASFGIIYSIIMGKGKTWFGTIYGILIGIGFMMSPVVVALGVGQFGVDFGWGFPVTVALAHALFGTIVGWFAFKKNETGTSIFHAIGDLIFNRKGVTKMTECVTCGIPISIPSGKIDEKSAPAKSEFKGKTYYFCSSNCKVAFDRDPSEWILRKESFGPLGQAFVDKSESVSNDHEHKH